MNWVHLKLKFLSLTWGPLYFSAPLLVFFFNVGVNAAELDSKWERVLDALNATTPFSLASQENQDKGWVQGSWNGIQRIWNDGNADLYISGRYWHTSLNFSKEDRARYDDWGLGGGYGRSLVDEKCNQRLLYAMVVQDSFEKPMCLAGYGWLARWQIPVNLHVGAGYSVVIISNSTATDYIPCPVPVPLLSLMGGKISLFCTFFNSIFYFFTKVSF